MSFLLPHSLLDSASLAAISMRQEAGEIKALDERVRGKIEARPGPGQRGTSKCSSFRFFGVAFSVARDDGARARGGKPKKLVFRLASSEPLPETFCTCTYLATAPRLPLKAAGAAVEARKTRADDMMDCRKERAAAAACFCLFAFVCFWKSEETNPLLCLCATKGARSFLFRKVQTGLARARASRYAECECVEWGRRGGEGEK